MPAVSRFAKNHPPRIRWVVPNFGMLMPTSILPYTAQGPLQLNKLSKKLEKQVFTFSYFVFDMFWKKTNFWRSSLTDNRTVEDAELKMLTMLQRTWWRNGLAHLQQWPCYLQEPGFESHLQTEFFACNKVSPLNNQICATCPYRLAQNYQRHVESIQPIKI